MNDDRLHETKPYRPRDSNGALNGNGADAVPDRGAPPIGEAIEPKLFPIERWSAIDFNPDEEYRIDGLMPKVGVGLIFGASQSFKSFLAMHISVHVGMGRTWADRRTEAAPAVYVAAEGAGGLRKRKAGYIKDWGENGDVDFAVVSAAPNLGATPGDLPALIATIEGARMCPGLIVLDTAAKLMNGADENNQGMAALLVNAEALARHFGCFVLIVHHTGWGDDAKRRPRGWSGLPFGLDLIVLCERKERELSATVTVQKLKDDRAETQFVVHMKRVALGESKTGREISTLIVDRVEVPEPEAAAENAKPQREQSQAATLRNAFLEIYDRLADAAPDTSWKGYAGVRKVKVEAIEAALLDAGRLEKAPASDLVSSGSSRPSRRAQTAVFKARQFLLDKKTLIEGKGLIWRAK